MSFTKYERKRDKRAFIINTEYKNTTLLKENKVKLILLF